MTDLGEGYDMVRGRVVLRRRVTCALTVYRQSLVLYEKLKRGSEAGQGSSSWGGVRVWAQCLRRKHTWTWDGVEMGHDGALFDMVGAIGRAGRSGMASDVVYRTYPVSWGDDDRRNGWGCGWARFS